MNYLLFNEEDKKKFNDEIYQMISDSDFEFVPPLSKRSSTSQTNLSGNTEGKGVLDYFQGVLKQEILGAFDNGELQGFVSFIKDFDSNVISKDSFPNIYISTLVSKKSARGKGLTKGVYDYLFNTLFPDRNIFTRTWSTNIAHISILNKFGFNIIKTIENDRGNNIHTVYLEKQKSSL